MSEAEIYPHSWDEGADALEDVRFGYEDLIPLFTAAAAQGEAMIM